MKNRCKSLGLLVVLLLLILGPALPAQATRPVEPPSPATWSGDLTTPQLIEAALARGEIDRETADLYLAYALGDYGKLPAQYRSEAPWSGTLSLLRLREAVRTMRAGPTRAKIEALLTGSCSTSSTSLPSTHNSTHFHIQYNTISGGLDVNAYANSLETAWSTEVTSFGWAAPPVLSSNPPPGNRYHVRIDDTLSGGLYGYVSSSGDHAGLVGDNPNTAWNDSDARATCMVLNADYSGFPGTAQNALDATTAHEFNHSLQFGYGALSGSNTPDTGLVEAATTWMEDEVQDDSNDNYNYLWPDFTECLGELPYNGSDEYRHWIDVRGMVERYGTTSAGGSEDVMQDFWEGISQGTGMLTALNAALVSQGTTLADAYHAYAIAVKFNKTCGGGYAYPYCFEEAAGYVALKGATAVHGTISAVGQNYSGSIGDNYATNWVSLPSSGGPYTVTLQNTSGGQLRGSVVCDTGAGLDITPFPSIDSTSSITDFDPSGCSSVVGVVTNQSQTSANPSSCATRSYMLRTDGVEESYYTVFLPIALRVPPPGPTPGYWSGSGVELYVTTDRAYVDDFALSGIYVPGCGTYKITHTPQEPISDDEFSFTGSFYADGDFSSETAVSGQAGLDYFYISGCGYVSGGPWAWSATWQNDSQPRLLSAKVVAPESVEGVAPEEGIYTATRLK